MTAEIAIMNKEAVALAADSAVTRRSVDGEKIFTSANKLFALSKYCPVGIMVYGSASFMHVPWESIIKIFRNKLGKTKCDTLKEYVEKFFAFLESKNPLFPDTQQQIYLSITVRSYYNFIREQIKNKVKSTIEDNEKATDDQVKQIISDIIKEQYDNLQKIKILPSIPKTHIQNIKKKYGSIINKIRKEIFEELPISRRSVNQLNSIAAGYFAKNYFGTNISGVVFAGFGEKDIFPILKTYEIEGMVNNNLKYKYAEGASSEIAIDNDASIIPFARKEVVTTFLVGIDPNLEGEISNYLSEMFSKYPEIIVENIEKYNESEKQLLIKKLKAVNEKVYDNYQQKLNNFIREKNVNPVIRIVSMLPKDELAAMAETLVSLTSFKLKVTEESETVAGPTDVAVISKGDGFVWIKRKHYFKPELNPQFFANYYREVKDEKRFKKR